MAKDSIVPRWLPAVVLGAVVAMLGFAFWHQRAEMERVRAENEVLKEQKEAALEEARATRKAFAVSPDPEPDPIEASAPISTEPPEEAPPPVDTASTGDAGEELVMTPTGFAPPPQTTGLTLAGTHVAPTAGGLQATLRFHPTQQEPLGIVAIVVRLPRDSDSRILDLNASGAMQFTDVAKRVSEDGKFAVFQGTAVNAAILDFALSVSEAATADVQGTAGIGPFDLDISPLEATVTPQE